ncbi:glycosyltransferase [Aristophania vespae]|uniref:Glycosyltransferase n=1 Tax=Aristophania vespae TaxID=2697033 RepID=A0A6P1NHD6_9PROT|nr:glycosyltransferase [Aristophania vespae]QHI95072.1 glycosyltransferase [Aristophania vespae]UMM64260.1 hypothetical protein DM15PD_12700 [Aristophania vespae]
MAVIYNTNYTHNSNSYLTLAISRAAEVIFGKENIVVADNMNLAALAASGEHDTLLCIDGQRLNLALMRRVRPAFKTMILWTFEDPFMQEFNVENGLLFDHIFTNDPSSVSAYFGKGHYLPLAASKWLHERPVRTANECDYDIFFAGTMWPNRVDVVRRVITAFPKARLKLVCPSNEYLPPLPEDIAALSIQWPTSHESFIDFANASTVTLTMFRNYASHGTVSQATAPGPRFFELALAGTAQVVEVADGMASEYCDVVEGVSLARNADEIVEAIAQLLNNKSARRRAAQAAQKSVLQMHLYEHRLEQIRDITQANFGKRPVKSVEKIERRRRLRVLLCTHSTLHEQEWGGVEVYQQVLCSLLGRDVEFFFWLRRGGFCRLLSASGQELECYDIAERDWQDILCDASEETLFSGVISQYNIDIVHFQHLGHHALSLPFIAKANGAGVLFSAHDFWLVSTRYNLLNRDMRYDESEFTTVLAMDVTLKVAEGVEYGGEQTRRAFIDRMLHHVDGMIFGTAHSKNLFHKIYPILDSKISLVNGVPSPDTTVPVVPKQYAPLKGRPLNVAIIGNFLRTKGADAVLALIELAHERHFHFHILGYVHQDYKDVLDRMDRSNVTVHGRYNVGNTELLQQADVALILSIWPETYCISLSEVWQNGLVPIVTDVGALHDRVSDGVNGFKVPINRPDIVLERLEILRSSERLRERMMKAITPDLWTHEGEYGQQLLDLYKTVAPNRDMGVAELQFDMGQLHYLPHDSWRHQAPPRHIFDPPIHRDLSICLPAHITDWFAIQGAECYVDDICHYVLGSGVETLFKSADEFHIRGWMFLPEITTAGQMYVVLIGEQEQAPLIFIECKREIRVDISRLFGGVPRRSGFSAQAGLRGKWCEGRYRIGLINVINNRGAFQLLSPGMEVKEGKIANIFTSTPSNALILESFRRVLLSDGLLRGIHLSHISDEKLFLKEQQRLPYFVDSFEPLDTELAFEENKGALNVRGWAFLEDMTRSGQLYIGFINEEKEEVAYFATERFARDDVQVVHREAPLCSGFKEVLRPWKGQVNKQNGQWNVVLINVVDGTYGFALTDFVVSFKEGRVEAVDRSAMTDKKSERLRSLLLQKL